MAPSLAPRLRETLSPLPALDFPRLQGHELTDIPPQEGGEYGLRGCGKNWRQVRSECRLLNHLCRKLTTPCWGPCFYAAIPFQTMVLAGLCCMVRFDRADNVRVEG
jgi:hypothetical protein